MSGNDTASAAERPKTKPGDTRFWCSCDPDQPYLTSYELMQHIRESRKRESQQ